MSKINFNFPGSERRFIKSKVELRCDSGGDSTVEGYAATWDGTIDPRMPFREKCCRGMFQRSILRRDDAKLLVNHSPDALLARVKNDSLKLAEDSTGLFFTAKLPNTSTGRDVRALVRTGLLDECSFGFVVDPDGGEEWVTDTDDEGNRTRTRLLRSVTLTDCSLVVFPAYSNTSAGIRDEDWKVGGWDDEDEDSDEDERRFPAFARRLFPGGLPAQPELRAILLAQPWRKQRDTDRESRQRRDRLHRALL